LLEGDLITSIAEHDTEAEALSSVGLTDPS